MTIQYSVAVRNARLDTVESTIGASAILKIFDGSLPANCAAADNGTVLATVSLPSDWMAAASGGTKDKSGTWQDASADNSGSADYFRIYDSGGSTCHVQGTFGTSGTDMVGSTSTFASGDSFTIDTFTLAAGNA